MYSSRSLIDVHRRFRRTCSRHLLPTCSLFVGDLINSSNLKKEAVRSSETIVNIYPTTRRHIWDYTAAIASPLILPFVDGLGPNSRCFVLTPGGSKELRSSICSQDEETRKRREQDAMIEGSTVWGSLPQPVAILGSSITAPQYIQPNKHVNGKVSTVYENPSHRTTKLHPHTQCRRPTVKQHDHHWDSQQDIN
jgi:hypothetical protein